MKTVSQLAGSFKLSRTALLYYEAAGLLKSAARSRAGYRLYGKSQEARLERICLYRKAGLTLKEIRLLLNRKSGGSFAQILQGRLTAIHREMEELQEEQRVVMTLLQNRRSLKMGKVTKAQWIQMFREAGLTDSQMEKWHQLFEKHSPDGHQEFLEFLNIPKEEIQSIRSWSKKA